MYDLQPIALLQNCVTPCVARSNPPVEFNGDAITLQLQKLNELGQRSAIGTLLFLAVHNDGHLVSVADKIQSNGCSRLEIPERCKGILDHADSYDDAQ